MAESKCGDCVWFTKIDNPESEYTHYCKLHYSEEIRRKNEKACLDWTRGRGEDGKTKKSQKNKKWALSV